MSGPGPRLFGTDGIRGTFGEPPLDRDSVRRLAGALAGGLAVGGGDRQTVVVGGDTRDSTPILCRWLADGLTRAGARVAYLGTVPTPAVAFCTRRLGAACGVAVSASHNPHPDNGIKLIDGDGFKWSPAAEARLEERMAAATDAGAGAGGGEPAVDERAVDAYLASLRGSLPTGTPLAGLRLAADAAHGAASPYLQRLFGELGAEVTVGYATPDGTNINRGCGSTHPDAIASLTRASGASMGLAFDGDADRVILVDAAGEVFDGDAILYLWARALAGRDALPGRRVVATAMSNLGLEAALGREGIEVVRCDVGDRAVVATMRREGILLGGEQSGHVVHLGLGTTGDGLLTALQMAYLVHRAGRPLGELAGALERFPQLLKNVPVRAKPDLATLPRVVGVQRSIGRRLGKEGRLLLRYSGTEPLARIMIEGRDRGEIESLAEELATVLAEELG